MNPDDATTIGPPYTTWESAHTAADLWTPTAADLGFTLQVRRDGRAFRVYKVRDLDLDPAVDGPPTGPGG